jgi:cytidyltransferase-like protein
LGQVVSQAELISHRGGWKRNGKVVVCASGRFNLLHPGHIRLLEQARALGDMLIVAVEGDARIRQTDAISPKIVRPVTPASERAEILAALACVDCAVEIDQPLEQFLQLLAPDIFVEGCAQQAPPSQSESHPPGSDFRLVRIPHEPGYSTTGLIERITRVRE